MGVDPNQVATIVLAGGQGTRLFPLTVHHSKPAVSFGGRYRLIDIPISNALHSNFRRIFVIAQYLSDELLHHIQHTYRFDFFQGGSVDVLTPTVNAGNQREWFCGTADAVRKNLSTLERTDASYFLILSGDHLYNIDFRAMVEFTAAHNADLTIAAIPVDLADARRFGILNVEDDRIVKFVEKPSDPSLLQSMQQPNGSYLGSMGIYVFRRDALFALLKEDLREDFGKHLITTAVANARTYAFVYNGYWEDIGTISSYYNANLLLTHPQSRLELYDEARPIYTRPTFLPGPQLGKVSLEQSILCEGVTMQSGTVSRSIVGLRTQIGRDVTISDSLLLGNHFYLPKGPCKIGDGCILERVILDEHVQLGRNVHLTNAEGRFNYDGDGVHIREGIIIVPAGTSLPDHYQL